MIHFKAYFIQHVNDFLIVPFAFVLLLFKPVPDFLEFLRIFLYRIERLQLLKPVPDLRLDLFPLQLIVLENGLHLFDQPFLLAVQALFLHSECALYVLEEIARGLYFSLSLPLTLLDHALEVFFLIFELPFNLGHKLIDLVDLLLDLRELGTHPVVHGGLQLGQVTLDVVIHDFV
jgi:hypothetical protein